MSIINNNFFGRLPQTPAGAENCSSWQLENLNCSCCIYSCKEEEGICPNFLPGGGRGCAGVSPCEDCGSCPEGGYWYDQ